jgi:drug/metabolite transporter (DMT)-like permease
MKYSVLKSELLLLLAAVIWGLAFVAQRVGMEFVGPFTFNAIRFALGAGFLIIFIVIRNSFYKKPQLSGPDLQNQVLIKGGLLSGIVLFIGASLQQAGIVYTTAGNAGFITGLYVVIVPIFGLVLGQKPSGWVWIGAFIAAIGLYFLSITARFTISKGDFLVLLGAFFWAIHVLIIGSFSPKVDTIKLATFQFIVCSAFSCVAAIISETITMTGFYNALIPILYGGIMSVGIAYTLQVAAQKHVPPAPAAIILSLETVFAALGGWIILNESMTLRGIAGCILMFAGMALAQMSRRIRISNIDHSK